MGQNDDFESFDQAWLKFMDEQGIAPVVESGSPVQESHLLNPEESDAFSRFLDRMMMEPATSPRSTVRRLDEELQRLGQQSNRPDDVSSLSTMSETADPAMLAAEPEQQSSSGANRGEPTHHADNSHPGKSTQTTWMPYFLVPIAGGEAHQSHQQSLHQHRQQPQQHAHLAQPVQQGQVQQVHPPVIHSRSQVPATHTDHGYSPMHNSIASQVPVHLLGAQHNAQQSPQVPYSLPAAPSGMRHVDSPHHAQLPHGIMQVPLPVTPPGAAPHLPANIQHVPSSNGPGQAPFIYDIHAVHALPYGREDVEVQPYSYPPSQAVSKRSSNSYPDGSLMPPQKRLTREHSIHQSPVFNATEGAAAAVVQPESSEPSLRFLKHERVTLSDAQSRQNHVNSEKRRRAHIKDLFTAMCAHVPAVRQAEEEGMPKSVVLQATYDYLIHLDKANIEIRRRIEAAGTSTASVPEARLDSPFDAAEVPQAELSLETNKKEPSQEPSKRACDAETAPQRPENWQTSTATAPLLGPRHAHNPQPQAPHARPQDPGLVSRSDVAHNSYPLTSS